MKGGREHTTYSSSSVSWASSGIVMLPETSSSSFVLPREISMIYQSRLFCPPHLHILIVIWRRKAWWLYLCADWRLRRLPCYGSIWSLPKPHQRQPQSLPDSSPSTPSPIPRHPCWPNASCWDYEEPSSRYERRIIGWICGMHVSTS